MPVKVSVIIPTYNRASLLKEAVESILAQSFQDWEALIVDDGSTDTTEALMKEFVRKDPRIHYLRQNRGGVSKARNLALSKAQGQYIAFLDDDDLFLKDKLESQIAYMGTHPEISFVYAQAEIIGPDGKLMRIDPEKPVLDYRGLFEQSGIRIQTVMCTKEKIKQAGGFDESLSFGEDYDLWLKMARSAPFHFMPRPVVKFRIHGTNACNDHLDLYLQRSQILEKVPLDSGLGVTSELKNLRLGLNDYRLGKLYYERKQYRDAAAFFARALRRKPQIGLDWARQENPRTSPMNIVKPYAAVLLSLVKSLGVSQ